jgi:hypothetical protein
MRHAPIDAPIGCTGCTTPGSRCPKMKRSSAFSTNSLGSPAAAGMTRTSPLVNP